MKTCRIFFLSLAVIPLLGCCAPKTPAGPGTDPDKHPTTEPDDPPAGLTVTAVPGWEADLDAFGIGFSAGDQIGLYCINDAGTSYYNVPFRTDDGVTFRQPDGKTLSFDDNSRVYAYYPYVKDAVRTLVKDVRIPGEQSGGSALKAQLFYAASGRIDQATATLTFVPVQSVGAISIRNASGKEITLENVSLELGGSTSGLFRHDLSVSPADDGFSLSPMQGTCSQKVILSGDAPYRIPDGGVLSLSAVLAPQSTATLRLRGYAGDGESWTAGATLQGTRVFAAGKKIPLDFTLTPQDYNLDIYDLIESMNLLASGDYSVPEKYQGRMRRASGVQNLRDFGGIALEGGGTTAWGVLYRSAALEDIHPDGKVYMKETLRIKTDIDLRNPETGEAKGYTPLGEGVAYFNRLGPWYVVGSDGIKEGNKRGNLLEILRVLTDKANYPLDFHCQVGRDRTGTVGAILAGLAGATKKAFYEDYLISFYAECCHSGGYTASGMANNIIQLYDFLSSYKDPALGLSANTQAFLLDLGLTAAQVGTLKEILLTGDITPAPKSRPALSGGAIEPIGAAED